MSVIVCESIKSQLVNYHFGDWGLQRAGSFRRVPSRACPHENILMRFHCIFESHIISFLPSLSATIKYFAYIDKSLVSTNA